MYSQKEQVPTKVRNILNARQKIKRRKLFPLSI